MSSPNIELGKNDQSQVQTSATNSSVIPKIPKCPRLLSFETCWVRLLRLWTTWGSMPKTVSCRFPSIAQVEYSKNSGCWSNFCGWRCFFFLGGGWLVFWGFFLGWGPHKMETNKYRIQRRMFRNQCGRGIYPYVWYAMSPTFVVDWYSDWMSFFSAQGVLSNIDTLH